MADAAFVNGLSFKPPHQNAPEWVKAVGTIKIADLIGWLGKQPGEWVNFDVKQAKSGKWYAQVNTFKRESRGNGNSSPRGHDADAGKPSADQDIPF